MIKPEGKRWKVDIQPGGRGSKRIRKLFDTKAEAKRFEAHVLSVHTHSKPWNSDKPDRRRLSELCKLWYELHGCNLRDGEGRLSMLLNMCRALRDPIAITFNSKHFAHYRQTRINSVSANTINHEHAYLRSVFNELSRLGEWQHPNPVMHIRKLKFKEAELSFLTVHQISDLLDELTKCRSQDAYHVARICLATGARWGEAEGLLLSNVQAGRLVFENPKDSERRAVPVAPELASDITVGKGAGRLFSGCYGAFRSAVKRLGLEIPKGQLTHILRHTFASHFIQNGGNILTLQRVLGHSDLKMTMRYAHLAPDHFEQVLTLNPLYSGLFVGNEKGRPLAESA